MEVKVCKNCRRLFRYICGPELCQDCIRLIESSVKLEKAEINNLLKPLVAEEEKKLDQVKEFIVLHPKATVAEIAEANDVSASKLFDWIRGDRLEFSDDSEHAWFECAICGTKIRSGMYCSRCKPK